MDASSVSLSSPSISATAAELELVINFRLFENQLMVISTKNNYFCAKLQKDVESIMEDLQKSIIPGKQRVPGEEIT
jgi:hypothetical protein